MLEEIPNGLPELPRRIEKKVADLKQLCIDKVQSVSGPVREQIEDAIGSILDSAGRRILKLHQNAARPKVRLHHTGEVSEDDFEAARREFENLISELVYPLSTGQRRQLKIVYLSVFQYKTSVELLEEFPSTMNNLKIRKARGLDLFFQLFPAASDKLKKILLGARPVPRTQP